MPNINDVKQAMGHGKQDEARQILRQVLQENPSAEAWYLAAQLSTTPTVKIGHLRRALLLDPNHVRARQMLKSLDSKETGTFQTLGTAAVEQLDASLERGGGRLTALVRQLPRPVRLGVVILLLLLPICLLSTVVAGSLQPAVAPTSTPLPWPTQRPYLTWQPQNLADHFLNSGLPITVEEVASQPSETSPLVQGRVVMKYTTPDGQPHDVRLMFYNTQADAFSDRDRLTDPELGWLWGVHNANAVLIYKADLPGPELRRLVNVLDDAIDPQQIQSAIAGATATAQAAAATQATAETTAAALSDG